MRVSPSGAAAETTVRMPARSYLSTSGCLAMNRRIGGTMWICVICKSDSTGKLFLRVQSFVFLVHNEYNSTCGMYVIFTIHFLRFFFAEGWGRGIDLKD